MSNAGGPPHIPSGAAEGAPGSTDPAADREAEALSVGRSAEELESDARDAAADTPRIPPLSLDEQVAAASADTGQAKAEEKSLSSYLTADELQQRARQMEADRHQRFKDAFEHIAIQALYIGAVVLGVLATIWALHLVMPPRMRWLSAEDLTHIQTLLTAGVLVGAVGGHFKKRLNDAAGDR